MNITAWRGFPIRDRVAAAVPGEFRCDWPATVRMALGSTGAGREGRSSCSAWWCPPGSAADWSSTARPYDGRTGNAGHVGHMVVDVDGPLCMRRTRVCRAIASGPRMAAWAREQGWDGADAKELADAAAAGMPSRCRRSAVARAPSRR